MNLILDPLKAYKANPAAAKKYGIPEPATYAPAPTPTPTTPGYVNITPQGLATHYAAQVAGKTYVAGEGYVSPTPTYKPRTETVLKNTLSNYISKGWQGLTQGFQEPFTWPWQKPLGTETAKPGEPTVLSGAEMLKSIGETPGRSKETEFAWEVLTPITGMGASDLTSYLDVASRMTKAQGGGRETGLERIVEGARTGKVLPENVTASPENELAINRSIYEHGDILPQFYEAQNDNNLAQFGKVAPVDISPERLDAVQSEADWEVLWDSGHKAPKVLNAVTSYLGQFAQETEIPVWGIDDIEKLKSCDYNSLIKAMEAVSEEHLTMGEMQDMLDKGTTMRLETTRTTKTDAFGNPVYTASWVKDVPYEPPKKKAKQTEAEYWEEWQTDYNHYWDAREVAKRAAQREESWEWSRNKDLAGWTEYYAALNNLKTAPFMNEWASSTTMFNELRRIWETAGGGQSWEQFLANYDFFSKWFEQRPEARGERPSAFAPILTGVSRL